MKKSVSIGAPSSPPRRVNFSTLSPHASVRDLLSARGEVLGDNQSNYRASIRSRGSIISLGSRPPNIREKSRSTGTTGTTGTTSSRMFTFISDDGYGINHGDGIDTSRSGSRPTSPGSSHLNRGDPVYDLSSSAQIWLRGGGGNGSGGHGGPRRPSGVSARSSTAPSTITVLSRSHGDADGSSTQNDNSNYNSQTAESSRNSSVGVISRFLKMSPESTTPSSESQFSFTATDNSLAQSYSSQDQVQFQFQSSALGDIYSNSNAMRAYRAKKLKSQSLNDSKPLRILFVNKTSQPLILCWVGFDNKLHHYYKLQPCSSTTVIGGMGNTNNIHNNGLDIRINGGVHSEQTFVGHSFVIGTCPTMAMAVEEEENSNDANGTSAYYDDMLEEYSKDIVYCSDEESDDEGNRSNSCWVPFTSRSRSASSSAYSKFKSNFNSSNDHNYDDTKINKIIAAYRPKKICTDDDDDDENNNVIGIHMATITEELTFVTKKEKRGFFQRPLASLSPQKSYHLSVTQCHLDSTPVDESGKEYESMVIGGWNVKCEKGLFTKVEDKNGVLSQIRSKIQNQNRASETATATNNNSNTSQNETLMERVRERLERDLTAAANKLPPSACRLLQKSTLLWINRSQIYGPKVAPIRGRGMCYHPGKKWLIENGMSTEKCGGIELYEAGEYLKDCDLWYGAGGVMLHELSHAFHSKFVKDGYDNQDIIDCYNAAMEDKLYECVRVHTLRGGFDERRAYACTNAMEYFAELSVAFLGGVGKERDLEFNKWYPFNRSQIKEHDPRAYSLLKRLWENEDNYTEQLDYVKCTTCTSY